MCIFAAIISGCSVARLSRRVWDAEVAGSNPATPTKKPDYSIWLFNFYIISIILLIYLVFLNLLEKSQELALHKI